MARTRIYISGPISNGGLATDAEAEANVGTAAAVFRKLASMGLAPLAPQSTWYLHSLHHVRLSHADWIDIDLAWIDVADVLFRIPGESLGADMEVAHALAKGLPVVHSFRELSEMLGAPEPFPLEPLGEK